MGKIRGVLLAGGLGSRLGIVTQRLYNKHSALVFDRPMISHPIRTMVESGVTDIILVSGDKYAGDFVALLGDGREQGLTSIQYVYQYKPDGIAGALREAGRAMNGNYEDVLVVLGDNFFEKSSEIKYIVDNFRDRYQEKQAMCWLKPVEDPSRFGVAELNGEIVSIEEKPKAPKSNLAIVGAYCFSKDVFKKIDALKPSGRGELEVTDLLTSYLDSKSLGYGFINSYWSDMGTPESLARTVKFLYESTQ